MTALLLKLIGSGNRRGVTSMVMAMLFYTCHDVLMKLAGQHVNFAQAIFLRGVFTSLLAIALVIGQGHVGQIRLLLNRKVLARSSTEIGATFCFVLALLHMPLGNITAIMMASPLMLTAAAALLLRETVGWRRWTSVCVGFIGVLLIVQPGAGGFSAWSVLALFTMLCIVLRDLITRHIGMSLPGPIMVLASCLCITCISGVMLLFMDWAAIPLESYLLLAGCAACVIIAYLFSIDFMRHGELAVVSPFRYAGLLFALLLGYLLWNEIPNPLAAWGIVLVLASGLYLLHRERVNMRRAKAAAP